MFGPQEHERGSKGRIDRTLTLRANSLSHSSVSPQACVRLNSILGTGVGQDHAPPQFVFILEANATLKAHHFLDLVMFSRAVLRRHNADGILSTPTLLVYKDGAAEAPRLQGQCVMSQQRTSENDVMSTMARNRSVSAFANLSRHGHPPSLTTRDMLEIRLFVGALSR
ncbi:LOW QUALITY PROTEIN: hypothetical protein ACO22_05448 [Paracoccidioides brasiliensis]|uniref:Uncharacterized protein n=1 Tax=Paracoccidioides brasiliensis TaxID=121759 RepID=A0A1D2JAE1_PARBR|nr:LOW QUALITY PROTEIN: hypothetical protein ACO22_05448 [Paracoccidioides brasiliensis]